MGKLHNIKVTNINQFEKLVEELQKNPSLARGFRRGTVPSNFKGQWYEISKVLNAHGKPRRTGDGWQKVWRDLKFKVKKKLVFKAECYGTGGGIFKQFTLSPMEETVANLLQFQKQLNPDCAVQDVECEYECDILELESALETEMTSIVEAGPMDFSIDQQSPQSPSASNSQNHTIESTSMGKARCTPSKRSKSSTKSKANCNIRHDLLQKHSDEQAKLLKDISNTFSSVKRNLRDMTKYQKQLLDIETKKIKLLEQQNKRQQQMHDSDLELSKLKILIKKRELEALTN